MVGNHHEQSVGVCASRSLDQILDRLIRESWRVELPIIVRPQRLNAAGSVFLTRPSLVHYTRTPDEFAWRAGELLNAIADGTITVTVSEHYRIEDAEQAHRDLQGRKTVGSVVLVP